MPESLSMIGLIEKGFEGIKKSFGNTGFFHILFALDFELRGQILFVLSLLDCFVLARNQSPLPRFLLII